MSPSVFNYCICAFLCQCRSFDPSLCRLSPFLLSLMLLFQGHVACQNFILTLRASCLGEPQIQNVRSIGVLVFFDSFRKQSSSFMHQCRFLGIVPTRCSIPPPTPRYKPPSCLS